MLKCWVWFMNMQMIINMLMKGGSLWCRQGWFRDWAEFQQLNFTALLTLVAEHFYL